MPSDRRSKTAGLFLRIPGWDGASGASVPWLFPVVGNASGLQESGKELQELRGLVLSLPFVFSSAFSLECV